MRGLRAHASVGLLLLLTCTLVGAAPTTRASVGQGSRRATELAMRMEELGGGAESTTMTKTRAAEARRSRWSGAEGPTMTKTRAAEAPRSRWSGAESTTMTKTRAAEAPRTVNHRGQHRDLRRSKADRRDRPVAAAAAAAAASPGRKDKYLKHITGPLYFSPKCRKHVYHVYHQTRDCTIAAYFKRCARLLTRLAGSPMCTRV